MHIYATIQQYIYFVAMQISSSSEGLGGDVSRPVIPLAPHEVLLGGRVAPEASYLQKMKGTAQIKALLVEVPNRDIG